MLNGVNKLETCFACIDIIYMSIYRSRIIYIYDIILVSYRIPYVYKFRIYEHILVQNVKQAIVYHSRTPWRMNSCQRTKTR